jgi:hypothetical protein
MKERVVSFIKEFALFILNRKKYWLVPLFLVMLLVGGLLVFSQGSVIAPLIYTLF